MELIDLDGTSLQCRETGVGEPVVFIHGAFIADTFDQLFGATGLTDQHRLIAYRRRGYGSSSPSDASVDISRQAADCRALCRRLGIERAHIVGHSLGGIIALELALSAPDVVHTLTLLEAALMVGASADDYRMSLAQVQKRYRSAGAAVVVEEFFDARFGEPVREILDRALPGVFEQAVADADTTIEYELPAVMEWEFSEERARKIRQPSLVVLGKDSPPLSPRFEESYKTLLEWLPNAEGFILPDAAHGMQMQNPTGLEDALAAFIERNPLAR